MTAVYDFFRFIKLYSTDGTTLEHTIEADAVTDTLSISRGAGVSWTPASSATDSFKIDVNYQLEVPVSTTTLRLTDVHSVDQDIVLVAGTNMNIVRDSSSQLTISSLVGGISKAISSVTQANPAVVQTTNVHNFTEGTPVTITDVNGMTQLNGNEYYMDILTGTTFALYSDPDFITSLDSTGFGAYTSGGVATGEYGGATKLNELSDAKASVANFTTSLMIGSTTTGTLNNAERNIFLGYSDGTSTPGAKTTSASDNIGIGAGVLAETTTTGENVAIGTSALAVSLGTKNVAVGHLALQNAFVGADNTAIGWSALNKTVNGGRNVAVGQGASLENTSGDYNISIGVETSKNNQTGSSNIAIGNSALERGTVGSSDSSSNIAVGSMALRYLTTGEYNIAIGHMAGYNLTTNSGNVVIGNHVGTLITNDTIAIYSGGRTGVDGIKRIYIDSGDITQSTGSFVAEGISVVNGSLAITNTGATINSKDVILDGAVTTHLIPDTNITYDLGSSTHKFRDLYLDGTSIYLGSTILKDDGAGNLQVNLTNVLQVAADDSTIRTINSGESIKFIGSGLVTTATDAEGNLTITGANPSGYNNTNWDDAYGWGNHASGSYLTSTGVLSSHTDVHTATPTDGQVLTWVNANSRWEPGGISGDMIGHIIPTTNDSYDIGSAEYKVRDVYMGSNSLWIGDEHKVTIEGGKKKFKKRKVGIVPAGVQTILITSVFADTSALKVSFKSLIHDPSPANILDPDHADFNPPTNKWQDFLELHGHPNIPTELIYINATDFDDEKEDSDRATTEGDIVYFDGTDYKRLPIGTAAQVLLANGSGTAPEWGDNSSGSAITVADEGSNLTTSATTLDFVGAGVTASGTGATKTITVPGGGSAPANERDFLDKAANTSYTLAVITGQSYYIKAIGGGGGAGSNNTGGPQTGSAGKNGGIANVEVTFLTAGVINVSEGVHGSGGAGSGSNNGGTGGSTTVTFTPSGGSAQDLIFCEGGGGGLSYGNRANSPAPDAESRINNNTNWTIVRSLPNAVAEGSSTNTVSGLHTVARDIVVQYSGNADYHAGMGGDVGEGANAGGGTGIAGAVRLHKFTPGGGGGSGSLTVAEEGSDLTTSASKLDFVGAGVTASGTGVTKTITISGGGGLPDAGLLESSFTVAAGDEIHYHLLGGGGGGQSGSTSGGGGTGVGGGTSAMALGKVTMLKPGTISVTNPTAGAGAVSTNALKQTGSTGTAATVTFTPDDLSGAADMATAGGGHGGGNSFTATASIGTAGANWSEISTEAIDSNQAGSRNQRYLVPSYGTGGNSFTQGAGSGGQGGANQVSPGIGGNGGIGNAGFAWVWKR